MNPADTRYAVPLDDVQVKADDTCAMCGRTIKCHSANDIKVHKHLERIYRLAEWCLWSGMSHKAVGSMMRVVCAKVINPTASTAQIAAAVGMTKPGVYAVICRIKKVLPEWYQALWGKR